MSRGSPSQDSEVISCPSTSASATHIAVAGTTGSMLEGVDFKTHDCLRQTHRWAEHYRVGLSTACGLHIQWVNTACLDALRLHVCGAPYLLAIALVYMSPKVSEASSGSARATQAQQGGQHRAIVRMRSSLKTQPVPYTHNVIEGMTKCTGSCIVRTALWDRR